MGLHVEQNTATLYECDLHGNTGPISPLQQQQITQLLEARHFCLNAQAVAAFLHEHASNWQNQGIPLPKVVDVMPLNAQVRGAVLCHSRNQQDTLSLSYIYITKDYCTWFNSTDDQPHYVLLNNNLCVITRKKEAEAPFEVIFKRALKPFTPIPNTHAYSSPTEAVWQQFFIQQKIALEKDGFIFCISHQFKKHYLHASQWLSQIQQKTQGFLQVDLFVEVDNQKINLLDLLDQIHQYNLSNATGDICLQLQDGRILLMPAQHLIKLTEEFGDILKGGRNSLDFHPNQKNRLQQLQALLPDDCHWQGDTHILQASQKLQQAHHLLDEALLKQTDCGINATLRPYQWLGVCWIQHLRLFVNLCENYVK